MPAEVFEVVPNDYAELLLSIPVGERVYVRWHYQMGIGAPPEPSEMRGTIIEHLENSTHIRSDRGENLHLFRGTAILDVDWL